MYCILISTISDSTFSIFIIMRLDNYFFLLLLFKNPSKVQELQNCTQV